MSARAHHTCPVGIAGGLDNKLRRWIQNPRKILTPYIKNGMTVLDMGCGPGFFTIDMAKMVGEQGKVIASDLQEGMLGKLRNKIKKTEFEKQIKLVKSEENKICAPGDLDFILMFYLVHEIADLKAFFKEIASALKPGGQALMAEPPLHVSKKAFEDAIQKARDAGLSATEGPKIFLARTAIFQKA